MRKSIDKIIVVALLAITLVGAIAWNLQTPVTSDDFNYMTVILPDDYVGFWSCAGDDILTFGQAVESAIEHHGLINGRFANSFHILFVPFGRIPESIFLGVVIAALALMMSLVASGGKISAVGTAFAVFLLWMAFPWFDQFQSLVYQMNYTLPSLLALLVVYMLPRVDAMGRLRYIGVLALGLLAGWSHEGFAAPLCAYIFFYWILRGNLLANKRLAFVLLMVFIGFVIDGIGGTFRRAHVTTDICDYSEFNGMITRFVSQLWSAFAAIGLLGIGLLKNHSSARKDFIIKYIPWLMAGFCGVGIGIVVVQIDRTLWPAELFFATMLLSLLHDYLSKGYGRIALGLAGAFAILYAVWMVELVRWEKIIGDENRALFESISRDPDQIMVAYADLTPTDEVPWYLLDIVNQPNEHWLRQRSFWEYFLRRRSIETMILPTDCKRKPFEEWPAASSDGIVRGRWPWLACSDTLDIAKVTVTFGPPGANMPPVDRLLVMLREGINPDTTSAMIEVWTMSVMMPDSTYLRRLQIMPLARTLRHRPILDIKLSGPDATE